MITKQSNPNSECAGPTPFPKHPKPYLSIRELSALTPWSEQAIRTMMARGVLREGVHFFHIGRRPVLKWDAIVAFIESGGDRALAVPHYRDLTNGQA
jgi:hypothetical protein